MCLNISFNWAWDISIGGMIKRSLVYPYGFGFLGFGWHQKININIYELMLNHVIYNIYSTDVGPLMSHLT
jgi:hypothetical protein